MSNKKSFAQRNARVSRPERLQIEMHFKAVDELVPRDHRCRLVWRFVEGLDLESFYQEIRVSDSQAGRSAIAPEILMALWLLATLDGISSARELARRSESDLPYMWICGGVSVNYHTLSDFRVQHGAKLDQILTSTVASLIHQDLVRLDEIGQDGMRVRAAAGNSSFRRKPTLEKLHQAAKEHLDRLNQERDAEGESAAKIDARRKAAAKRAAKEREERIAEALKEQEQLSKQREKRKKGDGEKTRVSTTDPEARRMKMSDGGFRPAYNVQFATDGDARVIVAVEVTNEGTDSAQLEPMLGQIQQRYEQLPERVLVDSAYANNDSVKAAEAKGIEVISTVPRADQIRAHGNDPYARKRGDNEAYARFRVRMSQPHYQQLYRKRPSIAEFPNADCRNRGLQRFRVRGCLKAKAVATWHALAFNLLRMVNMEAVT